MRSPSVIAQIVAPTPVVSLQGCGQRLAPPFPPFFPRTPGRKESGCPGSVGVSAGHKLPLGYLMPRSLPQKAEAQPSNPARHPRGLPPGRRVAGVLLPAGESPVAGAAPGTAAGCSGKRRVREPARARGAALLGDGAARAPCWPGRTCAPSPGSEVRPASQPGLQQFQQAWPQNTV